MQIAHVVRSVSLCVVLASGIPPAAAQINLAQRRPTLPAANKLPQTKINPSLVKVNKQAPVAFKPLEMVDPQTGKPIAPTAPIHLLPSPKFPNGRDIPAAQYYDQMNKLEAEMNKQGYSFRDAQKKHVANETTVDKAAIGRQAANVHTVPRNPKTAADMDRIAAAHRSYMNQVTAPARIMPGIKVMMLRESTPAMNTAAMLSFTSAMPSLVAIPKFAPMMVLTGSPQKPPASSMRPDIQVARYDKGPDNQPMLGDPASSVLTASQYVAVTFLGLMPPTKKFVWQIVQPTDKGDNFGTNGWQGWQSPWGLLPKGSGTAVLLNNGAPYLLVPFAAATNLPPGESHRYLMRIVPVNDDGSAAAFPSNIVTVTYGQNPDPPPLHFPPPPPPPPPYTPSSFEKHWPYSVGDPSLASIDLDEDLQQSRTASTSSTNASFSAGASLLGASVKFIEVAGTANTSRDPGGQNAANLSVKLLGIEQCGDCVMSPTGEWPDPSDKRNPSSFSLNRDFGPDIDVPIPFAFSLGPIDVSAQAGFRGSIGIGVQFGVSDSTLDPVYFKVGPYVRVGGYLEAAVGIGIGGVDIVQAGVDAQFTVLDFGVAIGLEGSKYYGTISQFVVLQGSLTAFTKAGLCPFCHEWDWTIFDYAGVDVLGGDPNKGLLFEGTL